MIHLEITNKQDMIKRNIQVIILTVVAFITSCNAPSQIHDNELDLVVSNRGSYTLAECDNSYFFLFEAQLINNTNTPKEFVAFNCLTSFNFLTNNDNVNISGNHCSSNSPVTFNIEPNKKLSIPLILQVKQNACINIDSIKIGFVFLLPKDFEDKRFRDIITDMKIIKKNILWSQPISFQLGVDGQYVIIDVK